MTKQLVCPKCKHEFRYDKDYLDRKVIELGQEVSSIQRQLAVHRAKPYEEQRTPENTKWWLSAKKSLAIKEDQLAELKGYRKLANLQMKNQEFQVFKDIVAGRFGREEFNRVVELVDEELESYNMADLTKRQYSRKGGRVITSKF